MAAAGAADAASGPDPAGRARTGESQSARDVVVVGSGRGAAAEDSAGWSRGNVAAKAGVEKPTERKACRGYPVCATRILEESFVGVELIFLTVLQGPQEHRLTEANSPRCPSPH